MNLNLNLNLSTFNLNHINYVIAKSAKRVASGLFGLYLPTVFKNYIQILSHSSDFEHVIFN